MYFFFESVPAAQRPSCVGDRTKRLFAALLTRALFADPNGSI
jgi:hypothetical protein